MRTDKELLIASAEYAKEDRWRSWRLFASTFAVYGLFTAGAAIALPLPIRIVCSILSGLVLVRIFILYHDFQHGAILKGSWLANAVMFVYGVYALNPPSIWGRSHQHHHKNNSKIFGASIGSFPIMTVEAWQKANWKERLAYRISRHPLTIAAGYLTIFLYGMCIRSLIVNPRKHWDSALSLVVHLGISAALIYFAWDVYLLVVLGPAAFAAAIGSYLFYAQHNYPGVKFRDREEWSYVFAALQSSSYIHMSPVMHWFTGNIGYHHVHHLNARIPFYRLPEAMRDMPELQTPTTTSLGPIDVARCLNLKLWDPDNDRLVSFRQGLATIESPTTHPVSPPAPHTSLQGERRTRVG